MQAWNYEADQIRTDDLLSKRDIVSNQEIDEFLSTKKDHNKFFLVAPKGLGKTLILKVKSKSNRDSCSEMNCFFIPKDELVEKIQITPISISYEKFEIFTRFSTWLQIWDICLTLTICKHLKFRLPESFEKILNESVGVSDILNTILLNWKFFISQNISQFQTEIAPIIRNVDTHTFMYLDSLDQAVGQFIQGYIETNYDERKNQQLIDLWSNSQLGLLYAISQICQKNRFIKIFASIRQEAFEMDISDLHLQIEDFTTIVKYSKMQLEQIFIFNIERTEKSKLVSPTDSNPYIRFVGFARMPHIFVTNKDEDFFDFIYRHTFGRPRELVRMGNLIFNSSLDDRTIKKLREKINTLSYDNIFEQFKREVIPYFDENKLRLFLSNCKCNIFSKDEAASLNRDLLRFYYKLGLIGIIKRNPAQTGYVQEFREAFKFNYKKTIQLPDSQYFVTHPAMDDLITTQLNKNYHSLNIIGFNYPFTFPKKKKIKTLQCCHFGVGNLGSGLVLPYLLKTGCKLILINRLSDRWKQIVENNIKEVIFNDSNSNEVKFFLLHDLLINEDIERIKTEWKSDKIKNLLILSNDNSLIEYFTTEANYITTSLKLKSGIDWCSKILNNCVFNKRIKIYPFENDKNLINYFKSKIKNKIELSIKEVIADRICSGNEITINNSYCNVHTTNESYGLVVVFDTRRNNPFSSRKFKNGSEIILCESIKEFEFYHTRKFWLFNCTHAILSVYIYKLLLDKNLPKSDWEKQYINVFEDTNYIRKEIELVIKAQLIRLILIMDVQVRQKLFFDYSNKEIYNELYRYSQNILARIFSNRDQLIRVLPINEFAQKYQSRIKELLDYYNNEVLYQKTKQSNIFESEDSYRQVRKSLLKLQESLLKISVRILND